MTFNGLLGVEWCHYLCRNGLYPGTQIKRFKVADEYTSWIENPDKPTYKAKTAVPDWPEYAPVEYTSPTVPGKPWADPDISDSTFKPKWNAEDGKNVMRIR